MRPENFGLADFQIIVQKIFVKNVYALGIRAGNDDLKMYFLVRDEMPGQNWDEKQNIIKYREYC
jgi:hypothetical protein